MNLSSLIHMKRKVGMGREGNIGKEMTVTNSFLISTCTGEFILQKRQLVSEILDSYGGKLNRWQFHSREEKEWAYNPSFCDWQAQQWGTREANPWVCTVCAYLPSLLWGRAVRARRINMLERSWTSDLEGCGFIDFLVLPRSWALQIDRVVYKLAV